jgi:DNA polymerase III sliding clamp (beta) subunit (PCNA family)
MKIDAGLLARALRIVSVSSQGAQITEKPSVLLVGTGKGLVCRTTDLGLFTETRVAIKAGSFASPVATLGVLGPLLTFVGAQNEDAVIDIEIATSEIKLSSGKDKAKVKTLDKKSFSSWPGTPDFGPMKEIDAEPIVKAMKDVGFSASTALVTPELYNVHVRVMGTKGIAIAEAADSRRYCRVALRTKKAKADLDALVPLRVVQNLSMVEGMKFGLLKNFVCVRFTQDDVEVTMWCRTSIGNYPQVTAMLPKKFSIVTKVDAAEFDRRLSVCMAYADANERDIELTVGSTSIGMKATDAASGAYVTEVKSSSKGQGEILLDSKHLHEFVQGASKLVIQMNGPKDVFVVSDEDQPGLLYAMWPLARVKQKAENNGEAE